MTDDTLLWRLNYAYRNPHREYLLLEAANEIQRLRKQRDELAWAIAWFLNGGSRDKLEERLKAYEATL